MRGGCAGVRPGVVVIWRGEAGDGGGCDERHGRGEAPGWGWCVVFGLFIPAGMRVLTALVNRVGRDYAPAGRDGLVH